MLRFIRSLFGGAAGAAHTSQADAQNALVTSMLELRGIVTSGNADQITTAIDVFKAKAIAGDLDVREREHEVAKAERMLAVLVYMDRLQRGEGVQQIAVMPDGEPAYFRSASVSRETNRDDDDYGQFDIGARAIFFDGNKRLTIVWSKVLTIGIDGSALIVHPARGGTPQTFYMGNDREASLAHAVASAILTQHTTTAPVKRRRSPAPKSGTQSVETNSPAFDLGSPSGACNFNIVGESHYQGRLRNISASGRSFNVALVPEPTNAFDPNAIRIVADDTVGYLSKEDALYYAPVFTLLGQHDRVGTCRAQLTGGAGEKRTFGVLLNLRDVDELLTLIRDTFEPGITTSEEPF